MVKFTGKPVRMLASATSSASEDTVPILGTASGKGKRARRKVNRGYRIGPFKIVPNLPLSSGVHSGCDALLLFLFLLFLFPSSSPLCLLCPFRAAHLQPDQHGLLCGDATSMPVDVFWKQCRRKSLQRAKGKLHIKLMHRFYIHFSSRLPSPTFGSRGPSFWSSCQGQW